MKLVEVPMRMGQYLESTIADKEREQLRLEGELSAMRSLLSTLRQFISQESKEEKP